MSFICNATDRKLIEGHFPGIGLDQYPLVLGHESVGIVTEVGSKVKYFKVGDRAVGGLVLEPLGGKFKSGWGGHSEYVVCKDDQAMKDDHVDDLEHGWNDTWQIMQVVPDDITPADAAMLCTWREVYAGLVDDFKLKENDDIVIFGAGPVGLSFVKFAKIMGLGEVISIDPIKGKRDKALQMGADAVYAPDDPEILKIVEKRGKAFDAVIDAVGHESIINTGVKLVKMGGSVCVYGVLGSDTITIDKSEAPYNFNIIIHQWPTRDGEAAAQKPLVEWVRSGKLTADDFVTGEFSITDFENAVKAVGGENSIKTMFVFDK